VGSLLAATGSRDGLNWIERGLGVVPIEFGKLVGHVVDDARLRHETDELLIKKRGGAELDRGQPNPILSGVLEKELTRLRIEAQPPAKTRDPTTIADLKESLSNRGRKIVETDFHVIIGEGDTLAAWKTQRFDDGESQERVTLWKFRNG
jgi:hypothetical protein